MEIRKGSVYKSEHYMIRVKIIDIYRAYNDTFFKAKVLESNNPHCDKGDFISHFIREIREYYKPVNNSIEKIT